jgi:Zn finger protein HypA/HybF involved in hydrogenase expression
MTRNRIATRRRAAGLQREPKPMPLKAKCRGCRKEKQVDPQTELCPTCLGEQRRADPLRIIL